MRFIVGKYRRTVDSLTRARAVISAMEAVSGSAGAAPHGAKRGGTARPEPATLDATRRAAPGMIVTVSRFAPNILPNRDCGGAK